MRTRICNLCDEEKPIRNFIKRELSPNGRHSLCNSCRSKKESEYQRLRSFAVRGFDTSKFNNLDENKKLIFTESHKENISIGYKKMYANMSSEEKQKRSKGISIGVKKHWIKRKAV